MTSKIVCAKGMMKSAASLNADVIDTSLALPAKFLCSFWLSAQGVDVMILTNRGMSDSSSSVTSWAQEVSAWVGAMMLADVVPWRSRVSAPDSDRPGTTRAFLGESEANFLGGRIRK